jgi:hypothetical protein
MEHVPHELACAKWDTAAEGSLVAGTQLAEQPCDQALAMSRHADGNPL